MPNAYVLGVRREWMCATIDLCGKPMHTAGEQSGHKNRSTGSLAFDVGQGPQILVEVADDDYERAKGLMCRTELMSQWGMLFIMQGQQFNDSG